MSTQSEQVLENNLIDQLIGLGYKKVVIKDKKALFDNLKQQLEVHNKVALSDKEMERILNHLDKGNVFQRSKILRDKFYLERDNGTGDYIEFLNTEHWCQNQYQVTNQITIEGRRKNRYDVTLLVNGLPLVQIELKKRGVEMKKAFDQINRYQRDSFWSARGLFQYVQLFVISNGVNTKYFANNKGQSFKQTFYWANKDNKRISNVSDFAATFLEPCHLSKMICKYLVLHESLKIPMILRPYQYYAVEAIIEKVKTQGDTPILSGSLSDEARDLAEKQIIEDRNGFIWHTTGSGKTLTSFKASQLLSDMPKVHKVVFVVDRNDLDYQTTQEFNHFADGSVDGSDNTRALVQQLADTYKDPKTKAPKTLKLIVTTIQKLNNAIGKTRYNKQLAHLRDKRIVFIFDECHRSQFGKTHTQIKKFFRNNQMFGFTGTPIFNKNKITNEYGKWTTTALFGKKLHDYVITNAINDENVLRFSIEYVGRYKKKEGSEVDLDIDVEAIDTKELLESDERLTKIVDYIIREHGRKTKQKEFSAMFCVSNVDTLIKYYDIFQQKKAAGEHDLRVVTIFTFAANEADPMADDMIRDTEPEYSIAAEPAAVYRTLNPKKREEYVDKRSKLESYIEHYNGMYGTKQSLKDGTAFYTYYKNIAKRMKEREKTSFQDKDRADILLVVNMFLTGFDAKKVNTMYVDKNLKHHGLIQAFSRTNRTMGPKKSHGYIVCFRNLKKATDDAISLFSDKNAKADILMEPYHVYVEKFKAALAKLKTIAPTVDSVDELMSEVQQLEFVTAFREVLRFKNIMSGFSNYDPEDLGVDPQEIADYQGKYVDIRQSVVSVGGKDKDSIINEVDFELELIHRDEINVTYILKLLADLKSAKAKDRAAKRKDIQRLLESEIQLRSKKELIEKFINENLPLITDIETIPDAFEDFWSQEKAAAFQTMCEEEGLDKDRFQLVHNDYLFSGKEPVSKPIVDAMTTKPKLRERRVKVPRIIERLMEFVERFAEG